MLARFEMGMANFTLYDTIDVYEIQSVLHDQNLNGA